MLWVPKAKRIVQSVQGIPNFTLATTYHPVYNKKSPQYNNKNMLPTTTPAEVLDISPEALEIANTYLQLQDLDKTADELDMPKEMVSQVLARREVRAYVDNVFMNVGFNNRFKLRAAVDAIIRKKFQELEDSEMGSSKDIADLLALSHKISMEEYDKMIKLEQLRQANVKNQVNVQINETSDGSKYSQLIQTLLKSE